MGGQDEMKEGGDTINKQTIEARFRQKKKKRQS
jgi:hypothetical protein